MRGSIEMAEQPKMSDACACGSGKSYGQCCGANQACACGSGKAHKDCCGKA